MEVKTTQIHSWIFFNFLCAASGKIIGINFNNATEQFSDREALFGTTLTVDGIEGILAKADPPQACQPIANQSKLVIGNTQYRNSMVNTFVLIERGNCSFAQKVLYAQAAEFDAAIIYDSFSDELVTMTSPNSAIAFEIAIPSVFVGDITGYILEKFYLFDCPNEPRVRLYSNGDYYSWGHFFLPLCTVLGTSSLCIIIYMTMRHVRDRQILRRNMLSQQRLKRLPVKQFVKGDECDICAICLDDFIHGEKLRQLPCKHCYHCQCIDPWLTKAKRVCPLCKRRVLSDDESVCSNVPARFQRENPFTRSISRSHSTFSSGGDSFVSATEEDLSNLSDGVNRMLKTSIDEPCSSRLSPADRHIIYVKPVDEARGSSKRNITAELKNTSFHDTSINIEVAAATKVKDDVVTSLRDDVSGLEEEYKVAKESYSAHENLTPLEKP